MRPVGSVSSTVARSASTHGAHLRPNGLSSRPHLTQAKLGLLPVQVAQAGRRCAS
jgi:hypothetical protein